MNTTRDSIVCGGALLLACALLGQESPPVLRVTTRLVQINVLVHDKSGQPVTGLTKDDFAIYEKGKPRTIAFFSMVEGKRAGGAPVAEAAPTVFSNRMKRGETPTSATVVLFDALNTNVQDQFYARKELIRFIKQVHPEDRVAIYVLAGSLRILQDFTSDPNDLLKALARYSPNQTPELDASNPALPPATGVPQLEALLADISKIQGEFAILNRTDSTAQALQAIAKHLAGVPGRKNLIWLSSGFPFSMGYGLNAEDNPYTQATNAGARARMDGRAARTIGPEVERATRELNNAGVAIYPVDARGLIGGPDAMQASNGAKPDTFSRGPNNHDTMQVLADRTGGRAFINSNDLSAAIRKAVDDSVVSYNLGFYPESDDFDSEFHPLKVEAKRKGLDLRYRKGFFAIADPPPSEKRGEAEVKTALSSPLEATGIGLQVRTETVERPKPGSLQALIEIAQDTVSIERKGDRWMGVLDILITQNAPDGRVLDTTSERMNLHMSDALHEQIITKGLMLRKTIEPKPGVYELRVVVYDSVSGNVGSLFIPLKKKS